MSVRAPSPDTALIDALRARGQRVTSQRLVLHRHLAASHGHLTADELGRRVAGDLPGLSTPTVYATLELLCELGLARRIDAGGAALFEAATTPHHHLRCTACGRVQDVEGTAATRALRAAAAAAGFVPADVQVVVTGRCASCSAAAEPSSRPA